MLVKEFCEKSNLPVDMLSLWVYSLFEDNLNEQCKKFKDIWRIGMGPLPAINGFRVTIVPKKIIPLEDILSRIYELKEKYHSFEINVHKIGTYVIAYPNYKKGYLLKIEPDGLTINSSISEPKDLNVLDETLKEVLHVAID